MCRLLYATLLSVEGLPALKINIWNNDLNLDLNTSFLKRGITIISIIIHWSIHLGCYLGRPKPEHYMNCFEQILGLSIQNIVPNCPTWQLVCGYKYCNLPLGWEQLYWINFPCFSKLNTYIFENILNFFLFQFKYLGYHVIVTLYRYFEFKYFLIVYS